MFSTGWLNSISQHLGHWTLRSWNLRYICRNSSSVFVPSKSHSLNGKHWRSKTNLRQISPITTMLPTNASILRPARPMVEKLSSFATYFLSKSSPKDPFAWAKKMDVLLRPTNRNVIQLTPGGTDEHINLQPLTSLYKKVTWIAW